MRTREGSCQESLAPAVGFLPRCHALMGFLLGSCLLLPPFLIRAAEDGAWLPSPYAVNAPASPEPFCCQCQHPDTRGPTAPNSLKGKAQPLKLGARRGPGLLWGVSAGKVRGCTKLGGGATSPVVVSHHWEVTFRGTRVPSLGGASGPWGSSPC